MKKNILLILFLFNGLLGLLSTIHYPLSTTLYAAVRSAEQAAALAAEFMNTNVVGPNKAPASQATLQLVHQCTKLASEEPAFYVFNKTDNGGFVIVSADDRAEDIIGYSDEGQIGETINPNLAFWLRGVQKAISAINDSTMIHKAPMATTAIEPLLVNKDGKEITWDQTAPYYNLCPIDGNNRRCLTGCVATAAAQVMYKWRYPKKGIGTHSYSWENSKGTKKTLTVDYENTTYDWENMLPAYWGKSTTSAQKTAVATLMYHAGVACNMQYGSAGSGAFTDYMAKGLVDHFGYHVDKFITTYSSYYYPSSFTPAEYKVTVAKFTEYFNADLEAGCPIIMGGEDAAQEGGHEFVCDGRDNKGKFHINWGWEGDSNGYFSLSSLSVDGYNFSSNLDAIIGLRPGVIDTVHVTSIAIEPQTATLKINERVTIVPTLQPQNATVKTVFWSSSDQNIAQVSTLGIVRAIGPGQATITATTKDGGLQAACDITVTEEFLPSDVFELVTDAAELREGDDIIIEATYNNIHYCATNGMHVTKNSNYTDVEQVQIVDEVISLADGSDVAIFKLGIEDGAWTLTYTAGDHAGKKLSTTAAKKLSLDNGTLTWTLDVKGNYATVASTATANGRILYNNNNNNPRFSNYTSTTSSTMVLPQIYVRKNSKPVTVVKVTGVELGQSTAQMLVGQEVFLYYSVKPADATNEAVMWTSSNENVVIVDPSHTSLEDDKTCAITALAEGEATVTIKTLDGGFTASCVVTVTEQPVVPTDTTFVSASMAKAIGEALPMGSQTKDFYGVKGYVTVQNTTQYQGFWLDDAPVMGKETFQGFQCTMPENHLYLQVGEYVCLYGYIMNYNNEKAQIKNGTVEVIDVPTDLEQSTIFNLQSSIFNSPTGAQSTKIMENGQILFLRGSKKFNVLGVEL